MVYNSSNKIKVAFLGGASNSVVGPAHYSALNLDNTFELVAGCFSRHDDINIETGLEYGVEKHRIYKNSKELIHNEKDNIDAVIILTPTNQHTEQVLDFINNNIPVICEKALTGSVKEAEKIKNVLKEKNGFLTVIYNYLGYPIIRELKHKIKQGSLGKINHIQIEMPQESFIKINKEGNPITPQEWRMKDGVVPTISLDLGIHLHMFIRYLTDERPLNVVSKSNSYGNFSEIKDNINCIVEYTNNLTCNMWYSKIAIGNRNGLKIRVYGEKGSAVWLQEIPEILDLANSKGQRWKMDRGNTEAEICNQKRYSRFKVGHPAGFIEAFANYYQDIAQALQSHKNNMPINFEECFTIDEAYEGIQLFEAIEKSNKSKSWQKV